jgi:uncharacterized protein YaaN involved in tellurite resistance
METKFDAQGIHNAAVNIGSLLDDMSAFTALKDQWPNAGHFDLGVWLERTVGDRVDALIMHAGNYKTCFEDLQTTMERISQDFKNADGDNADKIKAALTELKTHLISDIATLDQNTENSWHNFSPNPGNKPGDGDGYNDNLNDPI